MAAYISNIVIDVGADFDQTFNLESSSNAPLDLSGYTATSKLKKHPASLNDKASFTVSFPNRAAGVLRISLGSSITTSLKAGRYSYDVLLNDGSLKTRIVSGSAIVTAGVTTG